MKVLIVDDHAVARDGLALLIEDIFDVDAVMFASEGRKAIQQALNYDVDLVLLDLSMPNGLDGMQTAVELKRILPENTKIVIFSMYDEEAYMKKAYEAGADGYLVKQLKREEIIEQLKAILEGQKVFGGQVITKDQMMEDDKKTPWDLPITEREKDVFILTVLGNSQKEIADNLGISVRTVENHRRNISKKLGSNKRSYWLDIAKKYNILELY